MFLFEALDHFLHPKPSPVVTDVSDARDIAPRLFRSLPKQRMRIPDATIPNVGDFTEAQLAEAQSVFERDAAKFYSEWFWFPFQEDFWVNCWDISP